MMSVKICTRILPNILGTFTRNNICCRNESILVTCITAPNLIKNNRFLSTSKTNNENAASERENVYNGVLSKQIKVVKVFSLSSSVIGLIMQPFMYEAVADNQNIALIVAAYTFVGFFTVVTPLLLHTITKKYVTHLDYKRDTESYIAKTLTFFCTTKETEFKPDDVKVPSVPGMFTSFHVNGKAFFMDPRFFENPAHYAKIMGYDKPIDFKLHEPPSDQK